MSFRHPRSAAGFTLIEALFVTTIVGILLAASLLVLPSMVAAAKADSGSSQLSAVLRTTREQAISERRNIEIRFFDPDRIESWRIEVDEAGTRTGETLVQEMTLGEQMEFRRLDGLPDTPDDFAPSDTSIEFTGDAPWRFTPEGTLVDANGDVVNGTVFIAQRQDPLSARAVTLFGPTALLREWRWDGRAWSE